MKFHQVLNLLPVMGCLWMTSVPGADGLCPTLLPGPKGSLGMKGLPGHPGEAGEPGDPADSIFEPPPELQCKCPEGPKGRQGGGGDPGDSGPPGDEGDVGLPGIKGDAGPKGNPGLPGPPGSTLSPHPPSKPGTIYVPLVISGKLPRVICHHFRRHSYVPGVPNNWLGWYETGKSGYSTYNKWMYYASRFTCPCSVSVPPRPTPSVNDMFRHL